MAKSLKFESQSMVLTCLFKTCFFGIRCMSLVLLGADFLSYLSYKYLFKFVL